MRANVNGQECSVNMEGVDTIGDLLQQLEVHAPPRDVIVGLRINGGECDSAPSSQVRNLPVTGVEEVELETRSPEAFACDARGRLQEYLAMIQAKFERSVECFDCREDTNGLEQYRLAVEELRLVITLWDQLNSLDASSKHPDAVVKDDLQGICDRLFSAQDRNDLSVIRTILAERLLPFLRSWRAQVQG